MCAQVQQYAGAYVLIAKDNQPTLAEDIFFSACPLLYETLLGSITSMVSS
ncbi:hypothetical protein ccbrp13_36350 [Ktedonobacteria bacterium brp13]|nr:hypothetical protein ccbrp13_36350 [Ktedonobacteria bacterium brp13]